MEGGDQATLLLRAAPNPPAKAWQQYRPFADPDSGLRIDRGAGFDSDAGLVDRRHIGIDVL